MRPIIGITLDWEEQGTFSKRPYYALRESYFDIIYQAGGLPVAIPYIPALIDEYLGQIGALIVPGGDFALDVNWYKNPGEDKPHKPSKRLEFDTKIIARALNKNLPFLGICAGMQIMGGIFGAKITADVNKYNNSSIDHRSKNPPDEFAHDVTLDKKSLLYKIIGQEKFAVNSAHNEAIVTVPENLLISATAHDGTIEAIEIIDKNFAIGVQWHPEFFATDVTNPSFLLIKALINQARG